MSLRQAEGMSIAQALAMTVAEIPVFLYSTFGQVNHFKYRTIIYIMTHTVCFLTYIDSASFLTKL